MRIISRKQLLITLYSKILQKRDPKLIKKLNSLPYYEDEIAVLQPTKPKLLTN